MCVRDSHTTPGAPRRRRDIYYFNLFTILNVLRQNTFKINLNQACLIIILPFNLKIKNKYGRYTYREQLTQTRLILVSRWSFTGIILVQREYFLRLEVIIV